MAFFRFNRDKRGYEHFYLVEPVTNRRGKTRTRVLYWYRTPPNVRVGRVPFDEEVQRALEASNPTVTFDWRKIIEAPIPSADAEKWRERRRAEKAEKLARQHAARAAAAELAGGEAGEATSEEGATERTPAPSGARPTYHISADQIRKKRRRRRGRGPRVDAPAPQDASPATEAAPAETPAVEPTPEPSGD